MDYLTSVNYRKGNEKTNSSSSFYDDEKIYSYSEFLSRPCFRYELNLLLCIYSKKVSMTGILSTLVIFLTIIIIIITVIELW